MRTKGRGTGALCGAVLMFGLCSMLSFRGGAAQEIVGAAEVSQEPTPTRAARLTFLQGAVTVEAPETPGTQPAQVNLPLVAGVHILTGDDGQAEVEFEDGSVVRLTPNTTLALDRLSIDSAGVFTTAASLLRGLAYAELRAAREYHYTLTAGGDLLTPLENATVRVDFDQPPAKFAVIDGAVEISRQAGGSTRQVRAGETLRAGEQTPGEYSVSQGVADDSWDRWNSDRDAAESAESSGATGVRDGYAGSQGYGWADLDANGTWYNVPGQGQVWQPQVAVEDAGFDPYGFGAWMWYPTSGYVWASGYSWGWTPYRCGSWNYFNAFGWGWTPAAGCGGLGWRFWGTGRQVNVGYGPSGYRVPVVPRPRPGPIHPIVPTRLDPGRLTVALSGQTGWGALVQRGPREIGGQIAMPLGARGADAAELRRNGFVGQGALARDYPVDRDRHVAVIGKVSTQPGLVHTEAGWQRGAERGEAQSAAPVYTGQSGAAVFRQRQEQQRGGQRVGPGGVAGSGSPGADATPSPAGPGSGSRPMEQHSRSETWESQGQPAVAPAIAPGVIAPRSMQRPAYAPPAGQAPRSEGLERGSRPVYVAPAQRPSYMPPAQPQVQRPYMPPVQQQMQRPYMPPAAQQQMPRYTPPPPPPPPAAVQHPAPSGAAPAGGHAPAGRSPR